MPLNNELSSTPSTPGSLAGSTYSMAGIKSLSTSKAARLGLQRKGKDLLSSAWTSLSPAGTKAPKEALSSLKSWSFSAATNLSKKYEEMRESVVQSPAQVTYQSSTLSNQIMQEPLEEDRVSQTSTESRRQSEVVTVDGIPQDTWSTLTEALWQHLWGDSARQPTTSQTGIRAADITEQFETLYATAAREAEEGGRHVAIRVVITSCSRFVTSCFECQKLITFCLDAALVGQSSMTKRSWLGGLQRIQTLIPNVSSAKGEQSPALHVVSLITELTLLCPDQKALLHLQRRE